MEDKNSFVLYCDIIHTISKLSDDVAGKLFKHLLEYVNDKNPETDNIMVQIAFEPIKQQLKRDLRKWKSSKESKSVGGSIGNIKRWHPDLYKKFLDKILSIDECLEIASDRKTSDTDRKTSDTDRKTSDTDDNQSVPIASVAVNVDVPVDVDVNEEKKSPDSGKPKPGGDNKKITLQTILKVMFEKYYREEKDESYYYTAKDADQLKKIITKIKYIVKQRNGKTYKVTESDVINSWRTIILNIKEKDQWIYDNLSIPNINSKFNELIAKIRQTTKSKSKTNKQASKSNANRRNLKEQV